MRNVFLILTLLIVSLPVFAQPSLIESYRPNLNKSSAVPGDDLGTNLAVFLLIIGVYFLFWLKQKKP